jgi:hypothetical protein
VAAAVELYQQRWRATVVLAAQVQNIQSPQVAPPVQAAAAAVAGHRSPPLAALAFPVTVPMVVYMAVAAVALLAMAVQLA